MTEPTAGTVCKVQPWSAHEVMVNVVVEPTTTGVLGAEVTGVSVHFPSEQLVIVSLDVVFVVTVEPELGAGAGLSVHFPSAQLVIVSLDVAFVMTVEPILLQCSSVQSVELTVEMVAVVLWVADKDEDKVAALEIEVSEIDSDEVEAADEETGTALDKELPGLLMVKLNSKLWMSFLAKEPEEMMSKLRVKSTEKDEALLSTLGAKTIFKRGAWVLPSKVIP